MITIETAGLAGSAPDDEQASTSPSGTAAAGNRWGEPAAALQDAPGGDTCESPSGAPEPVLPGREGVGAPDSSRTDGFSGEEAGSSAGTGGPAPDPLDEVLGAIDAIAAQTGICPACQRPLT